MNGETIGLMYTPLRVLRVTTASGGGYGRVSNLRGELRVEMLKVVGLACLLLWVSREVGVADFPWLVEHLGAVLGVSPSEVEESPATMTSMYQFMLTYIQHYKPTPILEGLLFFFLTFTFSPYNDYTINLAL